MERSGNFYKAIRLGYILISILIGCMAYNSLYEWQEIEALELGNKKIDELRKEINNINIQMIKFSLLGETILEWNDKDIEHESPAQEMQKLIKRMDQVFAFLKKQETDLVRPACEALAGASTQITISLSSLLSEEKFRRFLKDNKELLAGIINSSDNNGKAIGRAEKAVRDADSTIRKNQEIIFKRIEASETAQLKAMQHIVSFLDAKGKTGLLDDINKVYKKEKDRRGL